MTPQEKQFLEKALVANLIDQQQAQHAIRLQQQTEQQGKNASIAQCLQHLKYLSANQIQHLQQSTGVGEHAMTQQFPQTKEAKFGRYTIISELGRGGMGKVYKAYDPNLDRVVALKMLLTDQDQHAIDRFMREAQATAKLKHANIITLYDIGIEDSQPYFTMEFIEGDSLEQMAKKSTMSNHQIAILMATVADAVHYANKQGIIHRDLKPDNIMMKDNTPIVMDFGIAKLDKAQKKLSKTGMIVGTLQYMAPEQAAGKNRAVDQRSDVYSLGAILYRLLTGHKMFPAGSQIYILNQILNHDPVPPSKHKKIIARDLENICLKAVEKKQSDRYQSAKELSEDLRAFGAGETVKASPTTWQRKLWRKCKRYRAHIAVAIIALIVTNLYFSSLSGSVTISPRNEHGEFISPKAILINGKKIAQTQLKNHYIAPGNYNITLKFNDYQDVACENVAITAGDDNTQIIDVKPKKGEISLTSSLSEVKASFVHDKNQKETTFAVPAQEKLATGNYTVTFSKLNHFSYKHHLTVDNKKKTINSDLRPMILWRKEINYNVVSNGMTLAHLGDSLELIVSDRGGKINSYGYPNFFPKWEIPLKLDIATPRQKITTHDFNKDGIMDLIVANYAQFMVFDGKTKQQIFRWYPFWDHKFIIADANDDAYEDIVLLTRYHGIRIFYSHQGSFDSQKRFSHINTSVSGLSHPLLLNKSTVLCASANTVLHVDLQKRKVRSIYTHGSDILDIKIAKTTKQKLLLLYDSQKLISLDLDTLRTKETIHEFPTPHRINEMSMIDIDNDGNEEVLFQRDQLYCVDIHNKKIKWQLNTQNDFFEGSPVFVSDLDHDGKLEVVTWTRQQTAGQKSTNTIFVVDHQGNEQQKAVIDDEIVSMVFVDTNQDHRLEVLFLAGSAIHCLEYYPANTSPQVSTFSRNLPAMAIPPVAADLNGDKIKELIIIDELGYLHCLDGSNKQSLWKTDRSLNVMRATTADFDGNGEVEVFAVGKKNIALLSKDGEAIWKSPIVIDIVNSPIAVDVDGDHYKEIICYKRAPARVHCIDIKERKVRWQAAKKQGLQVIHGTAQAQDVNNDGTQEIFILSGYQVHCLDGPSGRVRWSQPVPNIGEGGQIVSCRVRGKTLIFAGQVAGFISCFDALSGKKHWHKNVLSGDIRTVVLHQISGRQCIAFTTANDEVFCLDAFSGEIVWQRKITPRYYLENVQQPRTYAQIIALNVDVNADGVNDLVTTCSTHTFYTLSGIDGSWLGDTNAFTKVERLPRILDLDGDHKQDMLFVDRHLQIFSMNDIEKYFSHLLHVPQQFTTLDQDSEALYLHYLDNLVKHRKYSLLQKQLPAVKNKLRNTKRIDFYNAILMISEQKVGQKLPLLPQSSAENTMLRIVTLVNAKQFKQALRETEFSMRKSIIDFDMQRQKYQHLFAKELAHQYLQNLSKIAKKINCTSILQTLAYHEQQFLYKNVSYNQLLELTMRYADPRSNFYKHMHKKFVENINREYTHFYTAIYTRHISREVLDYAIDLLPNNYEFRWKRAQMHLYHMHYEKAAQDLSIAIRIQPQQKQAKLLRIIAHIGLMLQGKHSQQQIQKEIQKISPQQLSPQENVLLQAIYQVLNRQAVRINNRELQEIFRNLQYFAF
ncbi:protein kinase domain-containing protein [Candidatus Uabimicrobium amorphum]|uniref:non-specific serine/threonine protein kinase n=1 Tax=Uabimicrobium amorphum TaxID=2596890 RepID=A0A5S9F510_UABAM|nr:protein kinase [Candidatus Uabimicrobium amorphum]BBM85054.1 protein kinase [Candidatus Uabimicrobium amorphum]